MDNLPDGYIVVPLSAWDELVQIEHQRDELLNSLRNIFDHSMKLENERDELMKQNEMLQKVIDNVVMSVAGGYVFG